METSYHGYFAGPVPTSAQLESVLTTLGVANARVFEDGPLGAWCVVEVQRLGEGIAKALGPGSWLWEVDLKNDVDTQVEGSESHSGTIQGWRVSAEGQLEPWAAENLEEEGFIRGGVMEDCALEYVGWYLSQELSDEPPAPPAPAEPAPTGIRASSVDPSQIADGLIEALITDERLEVVNYHARRTLLRPIERSLVRSSSIREAAEKILVELEDANEVVEIYADEDEVEALINRLARLG
jgi:hypothetical protein